MHRFLREYFAFSKRERRGLLVLLLLLLCIYIGKWTMSLWMKKPEVDFSVFSLALQSEEETSVLTTKKTGESPIVAAKLFLFDPNTFSLNEAMQLGFTQKQFGTIENYRNKGGRFFKPADLKKIYGIDVFLFERLKPWIRIQKKDSYEKLTDLAKPSAYAASKDAVIVEANLADSASLEALKGIGPVMAARIVKYRNRLGGFYSKEQLREVYGIDSALFALIVKQIRIDTTQIMRIDLNTVSLEVLKAHPYIGYKLARFIVNYRMQHGTFQSVSDLKKIHVMNEEIFSKIEKYLTVSL